MNKRIAFSLALFSIILLVVASCASTKGAGSTPGYNSPQMQGPSKSTPKTAPSAPADEKDKKLY